MILFKPVEASKVAGSKRKFKYMKLNKGTLNKCFQYIGNPHYFHEIQFICLGLTKRLYAESLAHRKNIAYSYMKPVPLPLSLGRTGSTWQLRNG